MFSRLAVVSVLVLGLVGCQTTDGEGTKQRVGTILGVGIAVGVAVGVACSVSASFPLFSSIATSTETK